MPEDSALPPPPCIVDRRMKPWVNRPRPPGDRRGTPARATPDVWAHVRDKDR